MTMSMYLCLVEFGGGSFVINEQRVGGGGCGGGGVQPCDVVVS